VDATVVIEFAGRTHALALRLDGAPGFRQLVELDYPIEPAARDLPTATEEFSTTPKVIHRGSAIHVTVLASRWNRPAGAQ
jgi:hypothetical protein